MFDAHDTLLETSIQGIHPLTEKIESRTNSYVTEQSMPKKRRLGPQNGSRSLGPEKLPKIVNCATIKETGKLKETMVRVQEE